MKKKTAYIAMTLAAFTGAATAGFDAEYTGLTGIEGAIHIDNGGFIDQNFNAGHFGFDYTDMGGDRGAGQFASGSFVTFCIELQNVRTGSYTYDVDSIANGPNPEGGAGVPAYDAADEAEVHAVVAAAIAMGWLNADLSANTVTNAQLAGIQGMIWKMVLDNSTVEAAAGQTDVATAMADIQNYMDNNTWGTVAGLKAMINEDTQDQLFIVPLPTAAFAGLLTLGGLAGVARMKNRASR
ncbi:MAG: hypothetical protein P1U42_09740 [Phycisphaerales bacterium]|nr:hypothetical protein [Phycisphaerales bacterium]